MRHVIHCENIGLRYGSGHEIIKDASFSIEPASFHFITGASGAGKTTLLKLIFMNLAPTRGFLSLFAKDAGNLKRSEKLKLRRKIGIVFQDFRLLDHLTTFQNVALPLVMQGQRSHHYHDNVIELLEWVELGDKINLYPPMLSGGEKQRAAIARAVIAKPDLLLADEPTGNVDPQLAKRILTLFTELHKIGAAVLIATHDPLIIKQYTAPQLTIKDGHVTYST